MFNEIVVEEGLQFAHLRGAGLEAELRGPVAVAEVLEDLPGAGC